MMTISCDINAHNFSSRGKFNFSLCNDKYCTWDILFPEKLIVIKHYIHDSQIENTCGECFICAGGSIQ